MPITERGAESHGRPALYVGVPARVTRRSRGLGEILKSLSQVLGVRPCRSCEERAGKLDELVVIGPNRSGPPLPRPGCWFVGANCYGFVQTLKFCCSDGSEYTERWGWCFGLVFAPPCTGRAFPPGVHRAEVTRGSEIAPLLTPSAHRHQ